MLWLRDIMVTVKVSKRKRMRSKVYLQKSLPFFVASLVIIMGGLLLIGYLFKEKPYLGQAQWAWFISSFLASQYVNLKYIVEK
jgi:hypothetical protein